MGAIFSSLGGTLVFGVVLLGLYVVYKAVLPKPLPGIPYNRDAAEKLFGDVPEMMGYVMRTKRIFVSEADGGWWREEEAAAAEEEEDGRRR